MHKQHWLLLAALANGQTQHVFELSKRIGCKPQQLNALWQHMPPHIRGLLRQHDGQWRLIRPLAIFDEAVAAEIGSRYGFQVALHPECTSSNDILVQQAKQNPAAIHRSLCLTHNQSAGRGRQGRQWSNRLGECLMFSLAWSFEQAQQQLGALSLVVALACQRALHATGMAVQIKWPNDLVLGDNKLGGILIETVRNGGKTIAVIGIGINFVLPKTVAQSTSVQTSSAHPPLADTVFDAILAQLAHLLPQFGQHGFDTLSGDYQAANRDMGQAVRLLQNGTLVAEGTVSGVTAQGALRLLTPHGEQTFVNGEISLRRRSSIPASPIIARKHYLLLDGGNSQLKWAWVEDLTIVAIGRAPYRNLGELGEQWRQRNSTVSEIIGCAVCGETKKQLVEAQLDAPIRWLASMPQGLGIRNHYRQPEEHGADRWFNALGARRFSKNACVVVSCGTAVTIDALASDDHYLGGTIIPGFHLMKEAMAQKTANLNRPTGKVYPFPTTTANALASGMMDAVCGSLLLMHGRLQAREGVEANVDVVLTGGGAAKVAQALPAEFSLDNTVKIVDNLVIYGLLNWLSEEVEST